MEAGVSQHFSTCPLYRDNPALFHAFVAKYSDIVQLAVEQAVSNTDRGIFPQIRTLAREAGLQGAVPQDLIAVHLSALAILVKTKPQALVRASIRQSRLLLVKMIGELALCYREQAIEKRTARN